MIKIVSINIQEFVNKTIKDNKHLTKNQFTKDLVSAVEQKKNGCKCTVCGKPIWAIGTALTILHT